MPAGPKLSEFFTTRRQVVGCYIFTVLILLPFSCLVRYLLHKPQPGVLSTAQILKWHWLSGRDFEVKSNIHHWLKTFAAAALLGLSFLTGAAHAGVISQDLNFSSTNQSMWGSGSALQLDQTQFIGTTWNTGTSQGGFSGGTTKILNPLWVAWNLCPVFCPAEPTKYLYVDTTTGLQVSANTQGKVGFDVGLKIDSGSVNALAAYSTGIDLPDAGLLTAGEFTKLNTSSALTNNSSLTTQFPTLQATFSAVLQVSAQFAATGCAVGACSGVSFDTGTIGGTQEIVSFNKDGSGGIEYFGGNPTLNALAAAAGLPSGFPAQIDIPAPGLGNIASITSYLPQPNATGGVNSAGTGLTATGQDNLVDLSLDVDNILSVATIGTGGLFGGNVDLGGGFGLNYDLVNVEMGPQIDLAQTFDLTPSLFVDLQFSQPVNVQGYGMVTSLSGVDWNNLPSMAFSGGITDISPTFYLSAGMTGDAASLLNRMFLDVNGNIKVDLLQAGFSTPFGNLSLGIGNLLDKSFDLFTTPDFFQKTFPMLGFNRVLGSSFSVDVRVPEPGVLTLLILGLMMCGSVVIMRRRNFADRLPVV
jgi:hypothetical protein